MKLDCEEEGEKIMRFEKMFGLIRGDRGQRSGLGV